MKAKDKTISLKKTLNIGGNITDVSTPVVMGIINVTPDSFYKGSRFQQDREILAQAEKILEEGAAFIDVGGYSSRPDAIDISEKEEIGRVTRGIKGILKEYPAARISVDTFRAGVARAAVAEGACMINDIAGGSLDPQMFALVAELKVPYVMMHMRGNPQNMRSLTAYEDILLEIIDFFQQKIDKLTEMGVKDIIIDPGFGFAKTIAQNYELLKKLNYFTILNLPLLVGLSRKSMVYKKLGIDIEDALNGTSILNTLALVQGASILRVHDVKEAVQAIKLYKLTYG